METEKQWAKRLELRLGSEFEAKNADGLSVSVASGRSLTYAHEILRYSATGVARRQNRKYETDLLISDTASNGNWIPRVVVECKKGSITTHDALTYSAKAATHKHVHPYLRYGVLRGACGPAIPGRLIRHGAYFDFMMAWSSGDATNDEWLKFVEVVKVEIKASRMMQKLLTDSRSRSRKKFALLHRKLLLQ